jgi:hypothetical protein
MWSVRSQPWGRTLGGIMGDHGGSWILSAVSCRFGAAPRLPPAFPPHAPLPRLPRVSPPGLPRPRTFSPVLAPDVPRRTRFPHSPDNRAAQKKWLDRVAEIARAHGSARGHGFARVVLPYRVFCSSLPNQVEHTWLES